MLIRHWLDYCYFSYYNEHNAWSGLYKGMEPLHFYASTYLLVCSSLVYSKDRLNNDQTGCFILHCPVDSSDHIHVIVDYQLLHHYLTSYYSMPILQHTYIIIM